MSNMNKDEMRQKLGNITQIRELLFGEKIEEYNIQFAKSKQEIKNLKSNIDNLSDSLEDFKSEMKEHLLQLKKELSAELNLAVDSVEKKLKYLSVNTYNEVHKVNQAIDQKTQTNFQKIDLVSDRISSQLQLIKQEASYNQEKLAQDLQTLQKQLSETLEHNLTNLTETKVSRHDLAEVLFELCLKLKGQDGSHLIAESDAIHKNGNSNGIEGELILLEENPSVNQ